MHFLIVQSHTKTKYNQSASKFRLVPSQSQHLALFLQELSINIIIMKANEMHYFSDLFDKVLYMFRTCPLFIIRSISTLYTSNRYFSCYFCCRLRVLQLLVFCTQFCCRAVVRRAEAQTMCSVCRVLQYPTHHSQIPML
jgi:hypothetical protein